jgi:hypothetical protein
VSVRIKAAKRLVSSARKSAEIDESRAQERADHHAELAKVERRAAQEIGEERQKLEAAEAVLQED